MNTKKKEAHEKSPADVSPADTPSRFPFGENSQTKEKVLQMKDFQREKTKSFDSTSEGAS